jgi:hypothetical protein
LVLLGQLVHRERLDLLVLKDRREFKVHKVTKVHKDHRELLELMDYKVLQVQLDPKVILV